MVDGTVMLNYQDVTPAKLAQAALTASFVTLYTVPTNARTIVKTIDVCNTTAGALQISICMVPVAGSAGTGNALVYGASVPANSTFQWEGTQIMNDGDFISAKGSAVGLTLTASGGEAR